MPGFGNPNGNEGNAMRGVISNTMLVDGVPTTMRNLMIGTAADVEADMLAPNRATTRRVVRLDPAATLYGSLLLDDQRGLQILHPGLESSYVAVIGARFGDALLSDQIDSMLPPSETKKQTTNHHILRKQGVREVIRLMDLYSLALFATVIHEIPDRHLLDALIDRIAETQYIGAPSANRILPERMETFVSDSAFKMVAAHQNGIEPLSASPVLVATIISGKKPGWVHDALRKMVLDMMGDPSRTATLKSDVSGAKGKPIGQRPPTVVSVEPIAAQTKTAKSLVELVMEYSQPAWIASMREKMARGEVVQLTRSGATGALCFIVDTPYGKLTIPDQPDVMPTLMVTLLHEDMSPRVWFELKLDGRVSVCGAAAVTPEAADAIAGVFLKSTVTQSTSTVRGPVPPVPPIKGYEQSRADTYDHYEGLVKAIHAAPSALRSRPPMSLVDTLVYFSTDEGRAVLNEEMSPNALQRDPVTDTLFWAVSTEYGRMHVPVSSGLPIALDGGGTFHRVNVNVAPDSKLMSVNGSPYMPQHMAAKYIDLLRQQRPVGGEYAPSWHQVAATAQEVRGRAEAELLGRVQYLAEQVTAFPGSPTTLNGADHAMGISRALGNAFGSLDEMLATVGAENKGAGSTTVYKILLDKLVSTSPDIAVVCEGLIDHDNITPLLVQVYTLKTALRLLLRHLTNTHATSDARGKQSPQAPAAAPAVPTAPAAPATESPVKAEDFIKASDIARMIVPPHAARPEVVGAPSRTNLLPSPEVVGAPSRANLLPSPEVVGAPSRANLLPDTVTAADFFSLMKKSVTTPPPPPNADVFVERLRGVMQAKEAQSPQAAEATPTTPQVPDPFKQIGQMIASMPGAGGLIPAPAPPKVAAAPIAADPVIRPPRPVAAAPAAAAPAAAPQAAAPDTESLTLPWSMEDARIGVLRSYMSASEKAQVIQAMHGGEAISDTLATGDDVAPGDEHFRSLFVPIVVTATDGNAVLVDVPQPIARHLLRLTIQAMVRSDKAEPHWQALTDDLVIPAVVPEAVLYELASELGIYFMDQVTLPPGQVHRSHWYHISKEDGRAYPLIGAYAAGVSAEDIVSRVSDQ